MKTGIIIIFHNNEKQIDTDTFIKHLTHLKDIEFCLVDNASKDKTGLALQEINDFNLPNVSLLHIKNFKSDISAIRASKRFMANQTNFKHLGYISTNLLNIKTHGLNDLLEAISENHEVVVDNIKAIETKSIKLSFYQSMFSVIEYLSKLEIENKFLSRQYLCKL